MSPISLELIKLEQRGMMETDWESYTSEYFKDLARTQIFNKQGGLEGNFLSFDKENMKRNNQKDFKHIS